MTNVPARQARLERQHDLRTALLRLFTNDPTFRDEHRRLLLEANGQELMDTIRYHLEMG